MENPVFAMIGNFFRREKLQLLTLIAMGVVLVGCASSDVSRDAASNIDLGVQNARNLIPEGNIADTYQNSSQRTKGAIMGGAAGAITGALASSAVGILPGTAAGLILGASYGSYIDSNTSLQDQLENRGATIIILGDQIMLEIPSARLFDPWTSMIKPQAYSTLKLVSRFVNSYTKMLVKVSAYTSDTGSSTLDIALSQQQADKVSKVLLASGMDARLLYAVGCGGSHLVVKNTGEWDSDNYRIEITLEKLYV